GGSSRLWCGLRARAGNDLAAAGGQALSEFRAGGRSGWQRGDRYPSARFGRTAGDLHGLEPAPSADGGVRPIDEPDGLDNPAPGDPRRPRKNTRSSPIAIPARPIISNRCGRRLYTSLMKATSLPKTWNL